MTIVCTFSSSSNNNNHHVWQIQLNDNNVNNTYKMITTIITIQQYYLQILMMAK